MLKIEVPDDHSVDPNATYFLKVDSAKAIWENVNAFDDDDEEMAVEIHLKCTHEGLIIDMVKDGEVIRTACADLEWLSELTK